MISNQINSLLADFLKYIEHMVKHHTLVHLSMPIKKYKLELRIFPWKVELIKLNIIWLENRVWKRRYYWGTGEEIKPKWCVEPRPDHVGPSIALFKPGRFEKSLAADWKHKRTWGESPAFKAATEDCSYPPLLPYLSTEEPETSNSGF